MITVNSYSSFSTENMPWTGIYSCKGEKHRDQFYCGKGDCAFDRKKKIRICEDGDWSEIGQPYTLGKHYFDCYCEFWIYNTDLILYRYSKISISTELKTDL